MIAASQRGAVTRSVKGWKMREYSAGKLTDYANGDRKVIVCGDKEVGVFKLDDEFYAWHNRCAHRSGPICQGRLMKRVLEPVAEDGTVRAMEYDESETNIVCPWHGYEYSIKTGSHQGNPRIRLLKAELTVRDG